MSELDKKAVERVNNFMERIAALQKKSHKNKD